MNRIFLWITLLAGVTACRPALAQEFQFAYVASADSDQLLALKIDSTTGNLIPVSGSPFSTGQLGNFSVVIDQTGRFLYVVGGEGNVVGYKIEPITGRLNPIKGPLAPTNVAALALDPYGRYAYAVQAQQNVFVDSIFAYSIDPATGKLLPLPVAPQALTSDAGSVAVDPLGKFVYAPNTNSDSVSAFSINQANGALTAISGSPFAVSSGPQAITFDSLGRFAYVQGSSGSSTYAFSIAATGALVAVMPASYATQVSGAQAVDPRGQFFYAPGLNGLNGFNIVQYNAGPNDVAGDLTTIGGSPFGPAAGPGAFPVSVAVDYTGTFAYAAYYTGGILGFKVDPGTGVLTALSSMPLATAGSPPTLALARPHTTPVYKATQIPEPPGASYRAFVASGINNLGEVTGSATLVGGEFLQEAFLYNGTTTAGYFGPGHVITSTALNDKGEFVGSYTGVPIGPFLLLPQSFLFRNASSFFSLDPRTGGESNATGINNAEHITGSISTGVCIMMYGLGCLSPAGLGDTHAFFDVGLGPVDIGTLGGNASVASAVNQHDEVVGSSNLVSNGPNHAFVYSHGSFHDLGMFRGFSSQAYGINDLGDIIGSAIEPSGLALGFAYLNGQFESLHSLYAGTYSLPTGINLQGDVVGTSDVAGGGPNHAFLYHDSKLVDLNGLTSEALPLLTGAQGINDKGQIVASGLNGALYVLTPIGSLPF